MHTTSYSSQATARLARILIVVLMGTSVWLGGANRADAATPLTIGETFKIDSVALDEERTVNVFLPTGYSQAKDQRFPVMYMLDGGLGEDFLHIAGLLHISALNGTMQPFILVGIENTERRRDLTGPTEQASDREIAPRVGGSAAFRHFIAEELIPQVERDYRCSERRALVGESLAGLFVIETLMLQPELFDTWIAVDPSLWWNDESLLKHQAELLSQGDRQHDRLFMATTVDTPIGEATARLHASLQQSGGLAELTLLPMPGETHASIYHPAAIRAFRALFPATRGP
ncbi:MAG: alpha/beta hydrolase-fold protein [Lysobacteraceae bacterium]